MIILKIVIVCLQIWTIKGPTIKLKNFAPKRMLKFQSIYILLEEGVAKWINKNLLNLTIFWD